MADVIIVDAQTGEITTRDFTPEELAQRQADQAAAAITQAAQDLLDGNKSTLQDRAANALQANRDYLALASPTQAQAVAQVRVLTQENTALIRLLLNLVEGTD